MYQLKNILLTLSQTTNFDSSKLKKFADDNFNFKENGKQFSKQKENTVGKGEIARYEQFLLFPQCFKRLVLHTRKNQGLFWKGLTLSQTTNFRLSQTEIHVVCRRQFWI